MDIVVRGRNVQVQPRLKQTAREKLARISRFTHDDGRVEVEFSEVRNPRVADNQICEVTVHLKGHFVKAHAASSEPEAALDLLLDKVEDQDARIKRKSATRPHLARTSHSTHDDGRVEVEFSEVRNPRVADNQICEVTVHLKGHFVKAHAASSEPEAALDLVLDKVEHQVARIKEKRVSRSHP